LVIVVYQTLIYKKDTLYTPPLFLLFKIQDLSGSMMHLFNWT